ncbi:pilus assembly protein [Microbispora sp. NEAU-D428]|uniref:TadE/TadG family type IV pilus assembly protein n=1 Tax=Microbispora sitophila TaxID=2771537 RepID=UPI001868187A|nr:TadE/TadG family type IV pilus assembly protein [Microbispora sitophila]MBE3013083.1 pilus assembly protein [Microbispora sitophila]
MTTPHAAGPRRSRRSVRRRVSGDRGAATLEMVILFPLLLLVVAAAVQAVLVYQAHSTAQAAAQEGVRAARADGDAGTVEVVVTGRVPSFLPAADWSVSEVSRAPVERFIPASRP